MESHAEGKTHAKAQWWERTLLVRGILRALNIPWEPEKVVSRTTDLVTFLF